MSAEQAPGQPVLRAACTQELKQLREAAKKAGKKHKACVPQLCMCAPAKPDTLELPTG